MGDFPFVEWLAREYLQRGISSGVWSDYLKAHGLANYCVARDPREERYKLVYEIEDSWYKGKHPLTYSEHRHLTERHKHLLQDYRDRVREDFDSLCEGEQSLNCDDIFNANNIKLLEQFSDDVFTKSDMCSRGFVNVAFEIMLSCVETLKKDRILAPCHFTVIALGSVAKGEATPYSDLEYAFIVESEEDEYFTRLAVDSYFRIGNLGESPLETFDIAELKGATTTIAEIPTVGYRIDGIKKKAGNIPTGRVGGQKLTLTIDEFMALYKTEAESEFAGVAGDKSDMLSSSVPVFSSPGQSRLLYDLLQEAIAEYEKSSTHSKNHVNKKRMRSFADDIKHYNYLPDEVTSLSAEDVGVQVKTYIFRYPTLLANNIRMCLNLSSHLPWNTFAYLKEQGFLSDENHRYINIVLALSIYIRTKAYLTQQSQSKMVSLYSSVENEEAHMYHVPMNIYVILGYLHILVKKKIKSGFQQCLRSLDEDKDILQSVGLITQNIVVDKDDFMLKVELFKFVENHSKALNELSKGVGGNIEDISCEMFIAIIRSKYPTTAEIEHKYFSLTSFLLRINDRHEKAADFIRSFTMCARSPAAIAYYKTVAADCMIEQENVGAARTLLNKALSLYKQELALDVHQDILQHLKTQIECGGDVSGSGIQIYIDIVNVYLTLGKLYGNHQLCEFDDAILTLNYSLDITSVLFCQMLALEQKIELAPDRESVHRFIESMEISRCSCPIRVCVSYMAISYQSLLAVYRDMADFTTSLEYAFKALTIHQLLFGLDTNHIYIAGDLHNIANSYYNIGDREKALEYSESSLKMFHASHTEDKHQLYIAENLTTLGTIYNSKKEYNIALDYYTNALKIRIKIHGLTSNHPDVISNFNNIATVCAHLGKHTEALDSYSTIIKMVNAIYGAGVNDPNLAVTYYNVGKLHWILNSLDDALNSFVKSMNMMHAVYGSNTNRADLAEIYTYIAFVHSRKVNYATSIKYYRKYLAMRNALSVEVASATGIPEEFSSTAHNRYGAVVRYSEASTCYNQALISSVNSDNAELTARILCQLSDFLIDDSFTKFALPFLKIAERKAGSNIELTADIFRCMGKYYMDIYRWKEAEVYLPLALTIYQSLPSCKQSVLAQVHLSIGLLLLHLGCISQSLRHSQLALDKSSSLLANEDGTVVEYIKLNRDARSLVDSLNLVTICQQRFHEFKISQCYTT